MGIITDACIYLGLLVIGAIGGWLFHAWVIAMTLSQARKLKNDAVSQYLKADQVLENVQRRSKKIVPFKGSNFPKCQ